MTIDHPPSGFRHHWSRSGDGLRLHARIYGERSDDRLPVICLPGLARSASDFHALATHLSSAGEGRLVAALDYRGRGLSDHDPDWTHYNMGAESADVLSVIGDLGIAEAVIVGTSRGGLIGMGLAAARPDLVRGLVLNDVGPVLELQGLLRIKGYIGKLATPRDEADAVLALRQLFGPQFPDLSDADWGDWAASTWEARDGGLALRYDPALSRTLDPYDADTVLPDLWALFDGLADRPMLVIRGALSDLLSAETLIEMQRRHPALEAVTVPREGHAPLLRAPELLDRIAALTDEVDRVERVRLEAACSSPATLPDAHA